MGYYAGLTTKIKDRQNTKVIKNQPWNSTIEVFHSSLVDPCYEIKQDNSQVTINHKGAKQLIKALQVLINDNEK